MATLRDPATAGIGRLAAAALALLGLAGLLGACSSAAPAARPAAASSPAASPAAPSSAAVRATCNQVSAVLSDGPDPGADPVGYAEAQILPLSQIRTPDAQLRAAIGKLAGAYREFFASNGSSGPAKLAVAAASKRINSFCPGAAS
jgi:hypothetical protein